MVERLLRRVLFASRWLLVPLYVAVALCLFALVFRAVLKLSSFVVGFAQQTEAATIVAVLALVDLTLTGSLLVIVIFSGYENFVSRVDDADRGRWPTWMAAINFSGLKLKLMSSLVAISAIRLLEAFMDLDHESQRHLFWLVGIHFTFVVSSLVLAVADRLDNSHGGKGE